MFSRTPDGNMTLTAKNASIAELAGLLTALLGAMVVDQTGIEGHYNVSLQYAPDPTQPARDKSGQPLPPPADAVAAPSIFSALQGKLGLKLEARKVPVEVIVIDSAHRPSGN
jgi:uncharacterized protein (TIGR03435 family)